MTDKTNRSVKMIAEKRKRVCDICGKEINYDDVDNQYDVVRTKQGRYITFHRKCYLDTDSIL